MNSKSIFTIILCAACLTSCTGCINNDKNADSDATGQSLGISSQEPTQVTGIVGDGTSMHALEIITLDTGDSLYFTYEVNSTDGIEIGDTVVVAYDEEQGDEVALKIEKIS